MIVTSSVTDLIGRTPMVRINNLMGPNDSTLYAKLEWFNIGGSVKDRLALYIIEYAQSGSAGQRTKNLGSYLWQYGNRPSHDRCRQEIQTHIGDAGIGKH